MPTTPFFDQQFVGTIPTPKPVPNDGDSLVYRLSDADLSLSHGKAVTRVAVSYTFHDGIGTAEVVYCYPIGTLILATRDRALPVQFLRAGMSFLMADGTPALVTKVDAPEVFPPPSGEKDRHGSQFGRVLGTVKYTGNYPHIDIHFDDGMIGTTPGHRFWCVRRKEWVRACDFKAGDLMRSRKNRPIRVRQVSTIYWANESLYNVEVEDFHNYFVGDLNGDSVWSHNGLDGGGCRVPKAAVVEAIENGERSGTTLTHRNGFYEVLNQQPVLGITRAEQRAGANWNLLKQLDSDPIFARQLGEYLGVDDLAAHMRSGKLGLRNPLGTEWHHPIDNPDAMFLLRRQVHREPALQPILHPGAQNRGGYGTFYGT